MDTVKGIEFARAPLTGRELRQDRRNTAKDEANRQYSQGYESARYGELFPSGVQTVVKETLSRFSANTAEVTTMIDQADARLADSITLGSWVSNAVVFPEYVSPHPERSNATQEHLLYMSRYFLSLRIKAEIEAMPEFGLLKQFLQKHDAPLEVEVKETTEGGKTSFSITLKIKL